jgi:hypothetical protein
MAALVVTKAPRVKLVDAARIGAATATRVPRKAALELLLLLLLLLLAAMAKCVWEPASANDDAMAAVLIVVCKRGGDARGDRRRTLSDGELQRNAQDSSAD